MYCAHWYKCPKCGHEERITNDDPAWRDAFATEAGPLCMKCVAAFLAQHVSIIELIRPHHSHERPITSAEAPQPSDDRTSG